VWVVWLVVLLSLCFLLAALIKSTEYVFLTRRRIGHIVWVCPRTTVALATVHNNFIDHFNSFCCFHLARQPYTHSRECHIIESRDISMHAAYVGLSIQSMITCISGQSFPLVNINTKLGYACVCVPQWDRIAVSRGGKDQEWALPVRVSTTSGNRNG
jgi:hypothetical protein